MVPYASSNRKFAIVMNDVSPATLHYFTRFPLWLAYVRRMFHTVAKA